MHIHSEPLCVCGQNHPFDIQGDGTLFARRYIKNIFEVLGFETTVPIFYGNVGTAATFKASSGSYIVYDDQFFNRLHSTYPMVPISILAHEVGHLVGQHQENPDSHIRELEADRISGRVLKRFGASPEQAILWQKLFPTESNPSHPNSDQRIQAILEGYHACSRGKRAVNSI